ncbi:SDR family NAD(P)-dependent oxidoreductase [Actinosynnema sp. NPDC047251]|uniref:Secreted protein n=1 Tax=Saccharothrix espanaensis (strain ATCC 51144 / DSM 44229 / JCM 9112 / NBRC 15066 / NRRL 15764) TaxID=1179773 RepID=K0K584_SACES|nr:SDR family NAD(P)-dependent oxidoreductase [Saccharothrix espanaensis]CCH33461.1 hypothetical protein BN6_62100 [Saccharothrix espanaensis DSM 44229]
MATDEFAGRTALATGASRGIGYGIALELLACGSTATITARKPDTVAEAATTLAAEAGGPAGHALAVPGNAASAEDRAQAVTRTVERFGRLTSWPLSASCSWRRRSASTSSRRPW